MAVDTLKRIGETVCSQLGFQPTSNGAKPPHIANGLFRLCTNEACDTRGIHEWIVSDSRRNAIPSEEIIGKYHTILERGTQEKAANIKELRFLLDEIFDQDNTVYPSYDFSVVTISSHWMIKKKVSSELGIGDFLFGILSKQLSGKRSPVIELLQKALSVDTDDVTKIVKPIITASNEGVLRTTGPVEFPTDDDIPWDSCKETIRNGFDQLAENIISLGEEKNSLLVLRRIVTFSVFATFLYLSQCNSSVFGGSKPPIVVDAGAGLDSVKKASELSYTAAKKAVEDYFTNVIQSYLAEELSSKTVAGCQKWIESMTFSSAERELQVKSAVKSYFDSFRKEGPAIDALARAVQLVLFTLEYKNNSPSDFCRVLGVRCGLVGPKGNRANVKRYLLNSFMLETITFSALCSEELKDGVEMREVSRRLFDTYNIVVGSDSENDYDCLARYNIAQATPGDLRGDLSVNAQCLASTFISMGLGRKYADGVTLIGWRL